MSSIRTYLITVILSLVTLFNFLAAINGYQASMAQAERLFDAQLLNTAKLLVHVSQTQQNEATIRWDVDSHLMRASHLTFQVWEQGRLQVAAPDAPEEAISSFSQGFHYQNFNQTRWRTVSYFDEKSNRWALVAQLVDERYLLAEGVVVQSIWPMLMGLPLLALIIWLTVSYGLQPLRDLARQLATKKADDLSPIQISPLKSEIAQIVRTSNDLLQRLENSLLREKQFASDAAHELRTPLSVLKIQLFNLTDELDSAPLSELTATVKRFEHVIEQILSLYRTSPDLYHGQFTQLNLYKLAEDVLSENYAQFEAKDQLIELQGDSQLCVLADPFSLSLLIKNLVVNASKYTPSQGTVRVTISQCKETVALAVEDSGIGISATERLQVFERFYRVGRDRHTSSEMGCGLGLAIVASIVELHGASIRIEDSCFETGVRFVVHFHKETV